MSAALIDVRRDRGIAMLKAGLPTSSVAKHFRVTTKTAQNWRDYAFPREQRKLFDAVTAVALRKEGLS